MRMAAFDALKNFLLPHQSKSLVSEHFTKIDHGNRVWNEFSIFVTVGLRLLSQLEIDAFVFLEIL